MVKRKRDIFDKLSEEYKVKCLKTDSDTLYLFGNTLEEGQILISDVQDEIIDKEANSNLPEQVENLQETAEDKNTDEVESDEEEALVQYLTKDAVAKQQFEYNRKTCFTNDFPEIGVNTSVSVAPAEGKVPRNILLDPHWDIMTFSALDPSGQDSLHTERVNYKYCLFLCSLF